MAYQSYAKGGSFAPKETTTYLPALEENRRRIEKSEDIYFDQMRRNDQTRVRNAERAGEGLQALGKFSQSLSETLRVMEEKKAEKDQAEGLAMAYSEGLYGPGSPQRAELDAGETGLKEADAALNTAASEVLAGNPENYGAAHKVKELSGWKEYGYAMGKAQIAGAQYATWMQNALMTDNETEVVIGDQRFTPATARTPEQKAAAMSVLREKFNEEMGVTNVNPVLLAKYMFPEMYEGDARIMGNARREFAIEQSFQDQTEAYAVFETDKDFSGLLTRISSTVGSNGQFLGYRGAWNQAMGRLEDMYKAGLLTELDLKNIEGQTQPGTNKTFGELHKTKFTTLRRNIQDFEDAEWSRDEGRKQQERKEAESEIIDQLMSQENVTQADLDAAEATLDGIYPGMDSTRLNSMSGDMTVEAEAKELQEKQIKQLADAGLLTPERLSGFHWDLQRRYQDIARIQGAANAQTGGYQTELDSLKDDIEDIAKVTAVTARSGTVNIAVANAQQQFRSRVAKYLATGEMTPEEAGRQAYADLRNEIIEGSTTEGSQWYLNKEGFAGQIPKANNEDSVTTIRKFEEESKRIAQTLQALGGVTALNKTPNLIFTDQELETIEESFGRPGFTFPQQAIYWASQFGVDPIEIINAQRKAEGMSPLEIPPAIETVRQGVDPELQNLLHRYKSPERSARALGSLGTYNPTIVPDGFGDVIQEAATAAGIPPSILAGLIETESAWNPVAVSPAGARGIAQFMPKTAEEWGVNTSDPVSSINGAARYLRYLAEYFDGDLNLAIYAYNGGMGNIEKLGPGFDGPDGENYKYHGKVMRGAYKYGYGQIPVRTAFK